MAALSQRSIAAANDWIEFKVEPKTVSVPTCDALIGLEIEPQTVSVPDHRSLPMSFRVSFQTGSISLTLGEKTMAYFLPKKGWSHHVTCDHMAECLEAFCNQRVFRFARVASLMMRQIGKF